jgi:hypothetical protein
MLCNKIKLIKNIKKLYLYYIYILKNIKIYKILKIILYKNIKIYNYLKIYIKKLRFIKKRNIYKNKKI